MPYYQSSDGQYLKFGNTDLVIADGFQTVTSQIQPPSSFEGVLGGDRRGVENRQGVSGSHFSFGNDLTQTNQVSSIIPGKDKFSPSRVEVYQLVPNTLKQ